MFNLCLIYNVQHQLEEKGYKGYTLKEVINIKKLCYKYKQEKAKRSGNGACKKWKFFYDIDLLLTTRHTMSTPVIVVDTLAEDKCEMDNGQVEELDNRSDPSI
ncbi:Hypothetical predicted protein [Paramuricea clavata]|uniref:Uncharacterized protein n=1 Tax=Paramuricea clavata TaxID=317549 RepID=A0A6S7L5P7_PARCT|nr:Hypothetical predicted protein [Paramuricea clavata]